MGIKERVRIALAVALNVCFASMLDRCRYCVLLGELGVRSEGAESKMRLGRRVVQGDGDVGFKLKDVLRSFS